MQLNKIKHTHKNKQLNKSKTKLHAYIEWKPKMNIAHQPLGIHGDEIQRQSSYNTLITIKNYLLIFRNFVPSNYSCNGTKRHNYKHVIKHQQ